MKKTIRLLALLLVVLMVVFAFAACGKKEEVKEDDKQEDNKQEDNKKEEDKKEEEPKDKTSSKDSMIICLNQIIQTLDPCTKTASRTIMSCGQIAETLLWRQPDGSFTGLLAESWEQKDDLTWRLNIRKGVKFHNGEELKASDVVFSWKRACASVQANTNIGSLWNADACKVVDDYTVDLVTKAPCALAQLSMCNGQGAIFNEKWVTEQGDQIAFNACGTGPYKQDGKWVVGEDLKLVRFDDYWGEKALVKNITITGVSDTNTRIVMLQKGEADLIMNVEQSFWSIVEGDKNCELRHGSTLGCKWLAMGYWNEYLKNDDVRKAVCYSIDVDSMADAVYKGSGVGARSWLPKGIDGYTEDLETYPYNPDKAVELLKQAGYPDGVTLDFTYMTDTLRRNIAEIIQQFGTEVGITWELNELESAVWAEAGNTAKFDVALFSNGNGNADGDALYGTFHTEAGGTTTQNRCLWSNAEVDKLLEESRQTFDQAKRTEMFIKVQQIQAQHPVTYPLVYEEETFAHRANMNGWDPVGWNMYQFSTIWFD